ncbi:hypothetical protein Hdeb2414_s0012g00385181 [Helianthus debilis subsp. tardiflorus]
MCMICHLIEEFTQSILNNEEEMQSCKQSVDALKLPGMTDVVCEHKRSAVQSGFGLCKDCYMEFCGGLEGSEPPVFQRAQVERLSMIEVLIWWAGLMGGAVSMALAYNQWDVNGIP